MSWIVQQSQWQILSVTVLYFHSRSEYVPDFLHQSVMQVAELSQHSSKPNVWFETGPSGNSDFAKMPFCA